MRYILLVLLAFVTTFASAQVQFLGSPTTTVRNRGNFVSDSLFYLPKRQKLPSDTGALRYQISDSALYVWTGSAWRSTGTAGSAITGSGVAGYMPEFTTSTNLDTTRLYHSAGRFAIGSTTMTNGVFNVYGGQAYFDTSLKVGTQTLLADEGKNEVYVNTTSDAGAYPLQVGGSINIADNSSLSSAGRELLFMGTSGTTYFKSSGAGTAIIFQPNNVSDSVMYYGTDYELKIATSADAGNYKLQVAGAIYNTGNAALAASGGNVGIGTVSPTEALHVVGRGRFTTIDSTSTPINVLTSDVNGVIRKTSISATGIQGSGTTNFIPKFTASGTIGNSKLTDDGSTLTYLNDVIVFGENNTNTKYIKFSSSTGDFYFSTSSSIHQINGTGTKALQFQTNNTERMRLTSDGELLIGTTSDAGAYALQVAGSIYNTTGAVLAASSGNVGIGTASPSSSYKLDISGGDLRVNDVIVGRGNNNISTNTAVGASALSAITTGDLSVAVGRRALQAATSGIRNTAVGADAAIAITTGNQNTAIGHGALATAQTSNANTMIGQSAGNGITTGALNVGLGVEAVQLLTTGGENVAIGYRAGKSDTSGNSNQTGNSGIFIGYQASPHANGSSNQIVIGYNGKGNGNNTVTIGNSSTTDNYFFGALRTSAPPGGTANAWRLGTVATVTPTSPNRTIEVSIGGTIYYIHAKTTND